MRLLPLFALLVACQAEGPKRGYLGESAGELEIDGEVKAFDGGALEFVDSDGFRALILTTNGWHFTCEWAQGQFGLNGGKAVDRQGTHWDLLWTEGNPGNAGIMENKTGLFGGGTYGPKGRVQTVTELDENGFGTMETNRGNLEFTTHLCSAEVVF